jgi:small subunit ribosomal protein S26
MIVAQSLTPADEEAEFQRCKSINDQWNFEISKVRDARLAAENEKRREHIEQRLELKATRVEQKMAEIEQRVKEQKESSATFITRDNIDEAIEQALANPIDFNFSIDLQGNIYKGDEKPAKVEREKRTEPKQI